MKNFNREAIQRMFDGRKGGGGGGTNNADLAGYATQMWVNQNYVSIEFFNRLFSIHGHDPEDESTPPTDISVLPNDMDSIVDSIESMVGFYTEEYLSALGLNDDQGGGGITLNAALSSINNSPLGNPTGTNTVLMFNGTTWVYATMGSTDMNTVWTALADGTDTHQINVSHLTTALGSYFTQGSGISITNTVGGTGKTISLAQIQDLTAGTYKSVTVDQYGRVTAGTNPTTLAGYGITDALASNTTFWGRTIANGVVKGGIDQASYIEFADIASGTTNGGYIDFHYGGNTTANSGDYTSRIIEDAFDATNSQGTLKINNILWAKLSTGVSIGTSTISSDYKLNVAGYTKTTRLYLADGVYLAYDSTKSGVHLVGAGFYSDSYVSALGANSGGGGGGITLNEPLNGINNAGLGAPSTGGQAIVWNGSEWTYSINTTLRAGAITTTGGASIYGNVESSVGNFIASAGHGFMVSGGTSSQFLKADGSVDSGSYVKAVMYNNGTPIGPDSNGVVDLGTIGSGTISQVTLWGQPFNGTQNVSGSMNNVISIELQGMGEHSDWGGFLDFHYNNASYDYTTRIIEQPCGCLTLKARDAQGNRTPVGLVLDEDYGGFVQFKSIRLTFDSSTNSIKVINSDGTDANFLARQWGNDLKVINLNADLLDGKHLYTEFSNHPFDRIPFVQSDGVLEIGRYIDFHYTNTTVSGDTDHDYSVRFVCDNRNHAEVILPSSSGTLALTSDLNNYLRSYSRTDIGTSPNFDNPPYRNCFFERRSSTETTGETGTPPPATFVGLLSFKTSDDISMIQIAGRNEKGWYIRGGHGANITLSGVSWQQIALISDIPSLSSYATQTWVSQNYLSLAGGGTMSSTTKVTNLNADLLDGLHVTGSDQNPYGKITAVGLDGVMEVGKYIDFHATNGTVSGDVDFDFSIRLVCDSRNHVTINLPQSAGRLALTSDNVASATFSTTASKISGANINGTTFTGESDITTNKWGTARNITIKDADSTNAGSDVSVDGSAATTLLLPSTIKATLTGNASTATKLASSVTLWGQSFDGSSNISGDLRNVGGIYGNGSISGFTSIELNSSGNLANFGGFIDFHMNGSSADYTARIIEDATGVLTISSKSTSGTATLSALRVGIGANGSFVQIGNVRLVYDSSNNAIKVIGSDGSSAANFYATGAVSAWGANTSGGGASDYIPLSGSTSITGNLTPSNNNYVNLGSSSKLWAGVYCTNLHAYGSSSIAGNLTMAGNITPTVNNQYSLGTSSAQFGTAFVRCARIGHFCIETDTDGNYSSSRSNEINNYNGVIHLQYNSTNGVTLAGGGGNVAVGTTSVSASYKLSVSGSLYCSSFTMAGLSITGNGQRFDINTNNGATNLPVYVTGTWYGTFQNGSDIRLKSIHKNIDSVNVNDLSRAPIFDFTWIDGRDKDLHLGSSAQFWRDIFPNAISTMYDGHYAMDYGATALAAAVITARKVVDHEARIRLLEVENAALRNEINQLKKVA